MPTLAAMAYKTSIGQVGMQPAVCCSWVCKVLRLAGSMPHQASRDPYAAIAALPRGAAVLTGATSPLRLPVLSPSSTPVTT